MLALPEQNIINSVIDIYKEQKVNCSHPVVMQKA